MGKSLEFVKDRIRSGRTNGMENNKYDWMEEQTPFEVLKESLKLATIDSILCNQTFEYEILNKDKFKMKIIYNPDAEYDYFTMTDGRAIIYFYLLDQVGVIQITINQKKIIFTQEKKQLLLKKQINMSVKIQIGQMKIQ